MNPDAPEDLWLIRHKTTHTLFWNYRDGFWDNIEHASIFSTADKDRGIYDAIMQDEDGFIEGEWTLWRRADGINASIDKAAIGALTEERDEARAEAESLRNQLAEADSEVRRLENELAWNS